MFKSKAAKTTAWILFSALLIVAPLVLFVRNGSLRNLPSYGHTPEFKLTDQTGKPFTDTDLAGKVWVADFVFTSCTNICPTLTQRMRTLQDFAEKRGLKNLGLLSITVDPETDTPEQLQDYAKRFGADSGRWKFLTGDSKAIENAVVDGFKMTMTKSATRNAAGVTVFDVMHGDRFVLIDPQGEIRGYYEMSGNTADMEELQSAIGQLYRYVR